LRTSTAPLWRLKHILLSSVAHLTTHGPRYRLIFRMKYT
jgi:hypothetical protein